MLKAEELLSVMTDVAPGKRITWTVYEGNDILVAKAIEHYVQSYFRTGMLMPIHSLNLGLNVQMVEVEYYDKDFSSLHRIVIEGLITKWKEKSPCVDQES